LQFENTLSYPFLQGKRPRKKPAKGGEESQREEKGGKIARKRTAGRWVRGMDKSRSFTWGPDKEVEQKRGV